MFLILVDDHDEWLGKLNPKNRLAATPCTRRGPRIVITKARRLPHVPPAGRSLARSPSLHRTKRALSVAPARSPARVCSQIMTTFTALRPIRDRHGV